MKKELTWEQIRKSLEHLKYSRFSEAIEVIKKELGFDDIPKEDYEVKKTFVVTHGELKYSPRAALLEEYDIFEDLD